MQDTTGSPPKTARVLIIDDHPAVRRGLSEIIGREAGMEVCGEAGTVADAREQLRSLKPDVAIIDIFLKNESGLELIKEMQVAQPETRILVCSMHPPWSYADASMDAGARGYSSKAEALEHLTEAIRCVLSGEKYVGAR
jgi:DNA-binding NarL/FixJ family response regulator